MMHVSRKQCDFAIIFESVQAHNATGFVADATEIQERIRSKFYMVNCCAKSL